jgi:hypothetical protein
MKGGCGFFGAMMVGTAFSSSAEAVQAREYRERVGEWEVSAPAFQRGGVALRQ